MRFSLSIRTTSWIVSVGYTEKTSPPFSVKTCATVETLCDILLSVDWLFVDKLFVSPNVGAWYELGAMCRCLVCNYIFSLIGACGIASGNMRAATIWSGSMIPVVYVRSGVLQFVSCRPCRGFFCQRPNICSWVLRKMLVGLNQVDRLLWYFLLLTSFSGSVVSGSVVFERSMLATWGFG